MTLPRFSARFSFGISLFALFVLAIGTPGWAQGKNQIIRFKAMRSVGTYSFTGNGEKGGTKGTKLTNDFGTGEDGFLVAASKQYRAEKTFTKNQVNDLKSYLQELVRAGQVLSYKKREAPSYLDTSKAVTVSAWTIGVYDQNNDQVCRFSSKDGALAIEACIAQVKHHAK